MFTFAINWSCYSMAPRIVISIVTIQITSNRLQYNEDLSQTFCFVWSCQMQFSL